MIHDYHIIQAIQHQGTMATQAYIRGEIGDDEFQEAVINHNIDMNTETTCFCSSLFGMGVDYEPLFNGAGKNK